MDLECGLLFLEGKCNRDKLLLIVVVATVAGHYDARVADVHLGPGILSESIDTE